MTYFTITRADTGYVAAWPTKGQVNFARLDKAGTVMPPGEIKTPGASGMRNGLVALSATDGAQPSGEAFDYPQVMGEKDFSRMKCTKRDSCGESCGCENRKPSWAQTRIVRPRRNHGL
ncbi:MAG: hypothetical protein HY299_02580 [Verrucomicrobia bacterium]|nr:hypothetical protein [Verrucomicrobiota bacterium]